MGTEIERKFLVTGSAWRQPGGGVLLRQGYLSSAAVGGIQGPDGYLMLCCWSRSRCAYEPG